MTALEEIKKALEEVTPGPWKAVSEAHFDSGLVYTSVQPVEVDEEAMKPLAMAKGEYHVCRMSHTDAFWRFDYHRKNARYIAAVNPAAISELLSILESLQRENERLRAGLEPFALMAENYDGIPPSKYHGDTDFQLHYPSDTKATLTIDYFRRARTALASTGGEHHGN